MTTQQAILDTVNNILVSSNATTSCSTRIYDTMAPQDPTMPFIVFTVVGDVPKVYFSLEDLGPLNLQLDVYAKIEAGVAATRAIADTCYAALHRQTPTASGYTGVSILCTDRGERTDQDLIVGGRTQQDAWRVTQTYKIFGTGT